jgi:hypothetical protein
VEVGGGREGGVKEGGGKVGGERVGEGRVGAGRVGVGREGVEMGEGERRPQVPGVAVRLGRMKGSTCRRSSTGGVRWLQPACKHWQIQPQVPSTRLHSVLLMCCMSGTSPTCAVSSPPHSS